MQFIEFKEKMFALGCFSNHQVFSWHPAFERTNFVRWAKKGYIIKLRNGFYTFPEYLNVSGFEYYIANRIYSPSYISLHYALHYYGIIPEGVSQITSISSLKTSSFENKFGVFTYQTMRPEYIFGYEEKLIGKWTIKFALLEKAIIDLFYLYSFYNNEFEIEELRFDRDMLKVDSDIMLKYVEKFQSKALEKRIKLMLKIYNL
ncbi:MAG: hypothetical protein K9J13_12755 [Saprospiraceae bacterium]|nr:hypothetical protein [Saprospiraceae bacterium]